MADDQFSLAQVASRYADKPAFHFLDIELANLRLANSPDIQIRRTQAASLKEKFLKTLRRYQSSESEARKKYQGRMERQYRIGRISVHRLELHDPRMEAVA